MFKKVIVGIDGRQGGQDALALARQLLDAEGELALIHIYLAEPVAWRGANAAYDLVLREEADKLLAHAQEESGVPARLVCHGAPSVGRGLHEAADKLGADLLVIGSSSRGHVGRVLSGDHTRRSLDGSPCAVAIAPSGYGHRKGSFDRIGVGYDETPESEHALGVARQLATAAHAQLATCHVVFLPARIYAGWPDQESIDGLVRDASRRLAQIEDAEPHAVFGTPAQELAQFSASLDLLVIGSRSYGPVGRLLYGSTARDLTRLAHCPLLVLTRGARRRHTAERDAHAAQAVAVAVAVGAEPRV